MPSSESITPKLTFRTSQPWHTHTHKATQIRSSGPGQFLGSYVVNWVLAARLTQWLKGLRHPRKKERKKHATKDGLRCHSLLFLLFALCVATSWLSLSRFSYFIDAAFYLLLSFRSFRIDTFDPEMIERALRFLVVRKIGIGNWFSPKMHASPQTL